MSRIPLVRAISALRRDRTPGTVGLYAALTVVALVLVTVPVCGPVQNHLARAHHGRPTSVATWAAFQVVPKMYSFAHRVWIADEPITLDTLDRADTALWLNHYPFRDVRFETARAQTVARGRDMYLVLRSAYRGRRWTSQFVVHVRGTELVVEVVP